MSASCAPGGCATHAATRPSPWWLSANIRYRPLGMKNAGAPCESFSYVSGSAVQIFRTWSSASMARGYTSRRDAHSARAHRRAVHPGQRHLGGEGEHLELAGRDHRRAVVSRRQLARALVRECLAASVLLRAVGARLVRVA